MKMKFPSRLVALAASLLLGVVAAHAQTELPLKKIKAPNNGINDAECGVTLTLPKSWEVMRAFRWGEENSKTTVVLQRTRSTPAFVSLFYQEFGREGVRPAEIKEWFHSSSREKQASKKKEISTYRNDPDSLTLGTTAGGLPRGSYFATFTKDSRPMVEYYVRVAGEKSYAMFLTQGTREGIEAMRAEIDKMADTLKLP